MKAYVSIDDGGFPVFNLTQDKISGVEIEVKLPQLKRWKKAALANATAQKEMHAAVDHYQPVAVKEARAARVAK
jgi:hypothetical protein